MDIKLRILKSKIRGLNAEGCSIRARITQSSGMRKNQLWTLKRELGNYTRCHLIAYGLLRGIPYCKIERKTATLFMPSEMIHQIILENTQKWTHHQWTLHRVRDLLNAPPVLTQEVPEQPIKGNHYTPSELFLGRSV